MFLGAVKLGRRLLEQTNEAREPLVMTRKIDPYAYLSLSHLAHSFVSLEQADGVEPWDAERLDAWACAPNRSRSAVHAARFVLHVFDRAVAWRCGPFDVVDAVREWDAAHRDAFLVWVLRPWWPDVP
jgi:hypothetical protein